MPGELISQLGILSGIEVHQRNRLKLPLAFELIDFRAVRRKYDLIGDPPMGNATDCFAADLPLA